MSVPFELLPGIGKTYSHYKHIKYEVRDLKGMLETVRRGINDHARLFPKDVVNRRYLDSFARKIDYLEGEVDSWKMWAFRMPPEIARREINILRNQIFCLMIKLGPAAEAQYYAVLPGWSRPKTTTPWRQISLTKVKKFKKAGQRARKQNREFTVGLAAAKAKIEALTMENLCLRFNSLKL